MLQRTRPRAKAAARVLVFCGLAGLGLLGCLSPAQLVQEEFRAVARQSLPAIVRIDVLEQAREGAPSSDSRPFFDYFFDNPDGERQDRRYQQESLGSGVIVRQTGDTAYVLTNAHVISEAQDITLTLDDGQQFTASLVGRDERKDLALVAFDTGGQKLRPLPLADSDQVQVGDWVLAMGSPYGFQSTVTAGIVSALHRRGGPSGNISDFIQTDASINKGNSGGALVNIKGELIGINTWITSQTGDSVGLGFSIPVNNVKPAISDFIEVGHIRYGWLGVSLNSLDEGLAKSLGLVEAKGALVSGLYQASPADIAGLRPGDVIVGLNGRKVAGADELIQLIGEQGYQATVKLEFLRDGVRRVFQASLNERKAEAELAKESERLWPGFAVYPLAPEMRAELELAEDSVGLLIGQIVAQGPAQRAGLKNRDLLVGIDGQAVGEVGAFYRILAGLARDARPKLAILRGGKELTIELSFNQEGN